MTVVCNCNMNNHNGSFLYTFKKSVCTISSVLTQLMMRRMYHICYIFPNRKSRLQDDEEINIHAQMIGISNMS